MAVSLIADVISLIPHIEEAAVKQSFAQFVMPNLVSVLSDMTGWNTRKVSIYNRVRRAQTLDEATDIPSNKLLRQRLAEISPQEVGDRYPISNRRESTDLESVAADAIDFLANAIGARREADLMSGALSSFTGGTYSDTGNAFDWKVIPDFAAELLKTTSIRDRLYVVVHPFAARDAMRDLVDFKTANNSVPEFRDSNISSWTIPSFNNSLIVTSEFVPRSVVYRIDLSALTAAETYRLEVLTNAAVAETITAAIVKSDTDGTNVTNIKAALEALTFTGNGTWTVATASALVYTVTPPAGVYFDSLSELRKAVNPSTGEVYTDATDEIVITEKSATAPALVFYRPALALDIRQTVQAYAEEVNQGRTIELSAYETYGVAGWRSNLGMTYWSKANSRFAVDGI